MPFYKVFILFYRCSRIDFLACLLRNHIMFLILHSHMQHLSSQSVSNALKHHLNCVLEIPHPFLLMFVNTFSEW